MKKDKNLSPKIVAINLLCILSVILSYGMMAGFDYEQTFPIICGSLLLLFSLTIAIACMYINFKYLRGLWIIPLIFFNLLWGVYVILTMLAFWIGIYWGVMGL
jgi:hypothetical protein